MYMYIYIYIYPWYILYIWLSIFIQQSYSIKPPCLLNHWHPNAISSSSNSWFNYTKLHCFRCAHPTIVVENRHAMNNCLPPTRLRKKRPENIDHTLWQQTSNIIRLIIKHQFLSMSSWGTFVCSSTCLASAPGVAGGHSRLHKAWREDQAMVN